MSSNRTASVVPAAVVECFAVLSVLLILAPSTARGTEPLVSQPVTPEACGPSPLTHHVLPFAPCPWCDSLNAYTVGSTGPFQVVDRTAEAKLWHCYDSASDTCAPPVPNGARAIWCGTAERARVEKPGYPNNTYQILYVDTGAHAANYTLTLDYNIGAETGYDFLYLIGGGGGAVDPICNSRTVIDGVIATGVGGSGEELLASWTGNIRVGGSFSTLGGPAELVGSSVDPPLTVSASITISAAHRALYFVFRSDSRFSQEDGGWCHGAGVVLDRLRASDKVDPIFDDAVCNPPLSDACGGIVIVGTPEAPIVSARTPVPWGAPASIDRGSNLPTADFCSPQKSLATDLMFRLADPATHVLPPSFQSIMGCPFALPVGLGSVSIRWGEYMDLPAPDGFVRYGEFRVFHDGAWSRWRNTSLAGGVHQGSLAFWRAEEEELAECEGMGADSVQIRLTVQCVQPLAVDYVNCNPPYLGLVLDDICLDLVTGVGGPIFGIFPGSVAQSTFVDGTAPGSNCTAAQIAAGECWPGLRGSDTGAGAINDNFNSPLGDSITMAIAVAGLGGERINWRYAFDKCISGGRVIAHLNPNFNPLFDAPRVIYRIFDPATKTWSPFDSSELDVDGFDTSCAPAGTDTSLAGCMFRMDWPPRDKYYVNSGGADIGPNASAAFPGGWTLNGHANYSQVKFLPRGTRVQYYFKGVATNGGWSYQFRTDQPGLEVEDLPLLPGGGAMRAPDIIEFDVLPRVYPAGAVGTLVAGRTDTPVLNLDGAYTAWSFGEDPVTKALRGMGVRADRYRLLQGLQEGNDVGGHEVPGQRVARLGNYFPNLDEYGILDSLKSWYRIIILSSHARQGIVLDEQDAQLLRSWWSSDTGVNAGDRCMFASGDDFFNALLNGALPYPNHNERTSLAQGVFGVATALGSWSGTGTVPYPFISDNFAGGGGASIGYKLDGGCPVPNRFDGLTEAGGPGNNNVAALYPSGTQFAGISRSVDLDAVTDNDRSKALDYGFSIQYVRDPNATPDALGKCCCCAYGGLRQRMLILYRFLTSCRGPRTVAAQCWPCPGDTTMSSLTGNWAALGTSFGTATFGPLYPIQDYTQATSVEETTTQVPSYSNELFQNRPNPFNPETAIPYSVSAAGRVTVRIYDVAGRLVRTLVDASQKAGPHVVRWNGKDEAGRSVGSGAYFYRITYPDGTQSARKMIILR